MICLDYTSPYKKSRFIFLVSGCILYVRSVWYVTMNTKKDERQELRLTQREKSALTKLAMLGDCTRSEWIRKSIRRNAIRKGIWDADS